MAMSWITENPKLEKAGCYPNEFKDMLMFGALWSWFLTPIFAYFSYGD